MERSILAFLSVLLLLNLMPSLLGVGFCSESEIEANGAMESLAIENGSCDHPLPGDRRHHIDAEELSSMSSSDLVQACIDYPLFFASYGFSSGCDIDPIYKIYPKFNGLRELLSRPDRCGALINWFDEYSEYCADTSTVFGEKYYRVDLNHIRLLLMHETTFPLMTHAETEELLSICTQKVRDYGPVNNEYSYYTHQTVTTIANTIIGRLLWELNYQPCKDFLQSMLPEEHYLNFPKYYKKYKYQEYSILASEYLNRR